MADQEIELSSEQMIAEANERMEAEVLAVSKNSDFLPRLQVCGSSTTLVKEGKLNQGIWALVWDNDRYRDVGRELDVLLIAVRPKALIIPQDGTNPRSYYKRSHPEFERISGIAMSGQKDTGCMTGPEYLTWLPTAGEFATLFLGSPTGRRASGSFNELMKREDKSGFHPTPAHIGVQLIKDTRKSPPRSWHGPTAVACTVPLSVPPDEMELRKQLKKFLNPPESVVEVVKPAETAGGESRER